MRISVVAVVLLISSRGFCLTAQTGNSNGAGSSTNSNTSASQSVSEEQNSRTIGVPAAASAAPPTATMTTSAPPLSARKIHGEMLNWFIVPVADFKNQDGSASAYNYLGVKYKITDTLSVGVRQPFTLDYTYEKRDSTGVVTAGENVKAHVSDLYLNFVNSKLVSFADDGRVALALRTYLPTGEKSRLTKTQGGLNPRLTVIKPTSKSVTVSYNFFPTWLNQTQNTYRDTSGAEKRNVDYSLFQYLGLDWNFAKHLTFSQALGTDSTWYKPGPAGNAQAHFAYLDSSILIDAIPNVEVIFGLSNSIDTHTPTQDVRPFRDSESTYYMVLTTAI